MSELFPPEPENLPEIPYIPLPNPDIGPLPLVRIEDGTVRYAGTRVRLDTIVTAYKMEGNNPEKIHDQFDRISIALIEKTIAYYESEREAIDKYLDAQELDGKLWMEYTIKLQQTPECKAKAARARAMLKQAERERAKSKQPA